MIHFEIDARSLQTVGAELGATEKQVRAAFSRALQRTAATLRQRSAKGLRDELQLRTMGALRKRLKTLKLGRFDGQTVKLWYGLNDMPVSWFKGRPTQGAAGASFRGREFPGAFVGRSTIKGRRTVFKRTTRARLHIAEQLMPVADKAQTYVEDEIFADTENVFWGHFTRDLRARVKYQLGGA